MAAPTAMDDFGQLPASRKALVFVLAGLLLGGLYYRFVYTSLAARTAEARAAYESVRKAHAAGVANLKKYDELRPEMAKLREQLARNQAALPTEAEVPAFFEMLERKVKESGVAIARWTKRTEEPIESFVKVPVEIELTGTFMQLKRFFASLVQKPVSPGGARDDAEGERSVAAERERSVAAERERSVAAERERIVSIESLVISQPQVRNREIVLAAKLVAVTFRQDVKAAVPGKPGATAPAAPVPPPLPRSR